MDLRPGWKVMSTKNPGDALVHEWSPRQCPRSTGIVYRTVAGVGPWQWRVSFWNEPLLDKRDGSPTNTADEAMRLAEQVIFDSGAIVD